MMKMEAAGKTDVGRLRTNNEDNFAIQEPLLIVCDGMGGAAAGEVASSLAVETITRLLRNVSYTKDDEVSAKITGAVDEADRMVTGKSDTDPSKSGMGTTVVLAVQFDSRIAVGNIGDSRAYLVSGTNAGEEKRNTAVPDVDANAQTAILPPVGDTPPPGMTDSTIRRITEDNSVVMDLVKSGVIEEHEIRTHPLRNRITRCVGSMQNAHADTYWYDVNDGDVLVLCSDGLWEMVHEDVILAIVNDSSTMEEACSRLVDTANEAGGVDNITVICARFTTS